MLFADSVLGLLLILVVFLAVTVAMNLWIGVPSVPTPMPIVRAMIDLAALKGHETIVDLGAGDGRLLIEAKRQFPGICARGWEIIPTVWLMGWLRMMIVGALRATPVQVGARHAVPLRRPRLILGDALKADVSDADVVFLYLFPSLLERLMPRFDRELKPGTRVISHTFKLPGKTSIAEKKVTGFLGETSIFLYQW